MLSGQFSLDDLRSGSKSRVLAADVLREFGRVLRDFRAVGAFRKSPERRYEYQGRVPDTIDAVGQNVVNALIEDDREERWDLASVHDFSGTYGDYLLRKVSRVFPQLRGEIL